MRLSGSQFVATTEFGAARLFVDAVTTTADSGVGSLRQAMLDANAGSLATYPIVFNIAASGVQTITPITPLPTITATVLLDDATEPGSAANTSATSDNAILNVFLDGKGAAFDGLAVASSGSTIRGLAIGGFRPSGDGGGVHLVGGSGNVIVGNFLGLKADGVTAAANTDGVAISSGSSGNLIGGTTPEAAERDLGERGGRRAGGLGQHGEHDLGRLPRHDPERGLADGECLRRDRERRGAEHGGRIGPGLGQRDLGQRRSGREHLGADGVLNPGEPHRYRRLGTIGVGNAGPGVVIGGANDVVIANQISGNAGPGVSVGGTNALISANTIGTDASGLKPLGNAGAGVFLYGAATVGGTDAGAGNVISGNAGWGVEIGGGRA